MSTDTTAQEKSDLPPLPRYHTPSWKLISQGAEARLWLVPDFLSITITTPPSATTTASLSPKCRTVVCKERYPRKYRHPDLDASVLKSRTRAEARCLVRCRRGGVNCPTVVAVDGGKGGSSCLFIEYVDGSTVREFLERRCGEREETGENGSGKSPPRKKTKTENGNGETTDGAAIKVASEMGKIIAEMHNTNIIHGDLTTSNVMLRNPDETAEGRSPSLCLIDFGLAGTAGAKGVSHEEKGVDLYVLERAFEATHPNSGGLVKELLRSYKAACSSGDSVLQRLSQVRLRGRKRDCFG